MKLEQLGEALVSSAVFAGIGLVVFARRVLGDDQGDAVLDPQGDRGGPQHRARHRHGRR